MTRREVVLSAVPIFAGGARRPDLVRGAGPVPGAPGRRLLLRRRAQPRRGPRPRLGCHLELPDAAARLPAAGLRGLAAAAVAPRRDPDGVRRRDLRRVAVVGGRHRLDRAGARLAPGRGRRHGARPADVTEPDAGHRHGSRDRDLPAAPHPLRAAGLDDAVHRPGPQRVPADEPAGRPARAGRADRPAGHRAGGRDRPGCPDPQRGDLARVHLAADRLAGGPAAPRGGGRCDRPARVHALDDPGLARLREPAAGSGRGQRVQRDRPGHLRLERPADPVALSRGRAGPAARDARRRAVAQLLQGPAAAGRADLGHRSRGAAVAGARRRAPAGRPPERHHVPRHEPPVPGRDDLGHVPPRRRAGPGAHRPVGAARARRRDRPARAAAGLDQSRSPGSARRSGSSGRRSSPSSCCPASVAGHARRPTSSPSWSAGWPPSVTRWTRPPARSSPTTRSGWPRPAASRRWRSPTNRRRTSWTSPAIRRSPGTRLVILVGGEHGRWPDVLDTDVPDADCFKELDLGPGPAGVPDPLKDTRAFEIVCP